MKSEIIKKIEDLETNDTFGISSSELEKNKGIFPILHEDNHVSLAEIVESDKESVAFKINKKVKGESCSHLGFNKGYLKISNNLCDLDPNNVIGCYMMLNGLRTIKQACPVYLALEEEHGLINDYFLNT